MTKKKSVQLMEEAAEALGVEKESLTKMNRVEFGNWLEEREASMQPEPPPEP